MQDLGSQGDLPQIIFRKGILRRQEKATLKGKFVIYNCNGVMTSCALVKVCLQAGLRVGFVGLRDL